MKMGEPTRRHSISRSPENWTPRWGYFCVLLGSLVMVFLIVLLLTRNTEYRAPKPAVRKEPVVGNERRERKIKAEDQARDTLGTPNRTKVERKSVELFPIENVQVLKKYAQDSDKYSALVGTVRNNAGYPVKGRVIAQFLSRDGTIFHTASVWVVDLVYTHAIGTDRFPITPSWIKPGQGGFFVLIDDATVFEEAADIEVTFKNIDN